MAGKINIKVFTEPGADPIERKIETGTTIEDMLDEYRSHVPYRIMSARVNGDDVSLSYVIRKKCEIIFCDIRDNAGNRAFQRGLSLLYLKAVHDVFGKAVRVVIRNSVNRGLFTTIDFINRGGVDRMIEEKDLRQIEKRMWQLVDANLPIKSTPSGKVRLESYKNNFYGILPPSTGYLCPFALEVLHNGVLVRFPHPADPSKLAVYRRDAKIFEAYSEEQRILDAFGLAYTKDLNRQIMKGRAKEIIHTAEDRHAAHIEDLAVKILESKKRIVFIAGPSSSGKTTFSKRLIETVKSLSDRAPIYLGTDDYFLDREHAPRDKKGEHNFEGLDAVDVELFSKNIGKLMRGRAVDIPRYDFITGEKIFGEREEKLEKGQIVIVEGIHALNKKMSASIQNDKKFKIYISPLTQINIDDHNRVPSTDVRLLRRIVRDHRTRGASAVHTLKMWPKVRAGESVNIFPYNNEADEIFNSTLIYELPVLKKYAESLLSKIKPGDPHYGHAKWLLYFLSLFEKIEDESEIPENSILREFIGGSKYS